MIDAEGRTSERSPEGDESGRAALITGASRGIGLAIAENLRARGMSVMITGRKQEALDRAVEGLGAEGAASVAGNLSDPDHAEQAVGATLERFGRLDLLVNNAGINPVFGDLVEADLDAARKTFETNVIGMLRLTQAAHRMWLGEHGGAIVNVASITGLKTATGLGVYGASKAAVLQLTRQLAVELAPRVRVNAVAPAVIRTKFSTLLYEGKEEEVASTYPLARLGTPEDVAEAVAFLGTERSSWISGETIVIDGGISATRMEG